MPSRSWGFACALGALAVACASSGPSAPAPEETFTMTTTPPPYAPPTDAAAEVLGASPWLGALRRTTHRYSNGCTDRREVDLLALTVSPDGLRVPILLGWRRASPLHREEPRFLTSESELPDDARGHACVRVRGSLVTYAHQGVSGAPAYAIAATAIEPAACP